MAYASECWRTLAYGGDLPSEGKGQRFESPRARHFGIKLGTPKAAIFAPARPPEVSDKVWAVMCELIALKNENPTLYDLLRERQLLDAVKKRMAPGTVELRTLQTAKAALKRQLSCK